MYNPTYIMHRRNIIRRKVMKKGISVLSKLTLALVVALTALLIINPIEAFALDVEKSVNVSGVMEPAKGAFMDNYMYQVATDNDHAFAYFAGWYDANKKQVLTPVFEEGVPYYARVYVKASSGRACTEATKVTINGIACTSFEKLDECSGFYYAGPFFMDSSKNRVSVVASVGGTVSFDKPLAVAGDIVNLVTKPLARCRLDYIYVISGQTQIPVVGIGSTWRFIMPDAPVTIVAGYASASQSNNIDLIVINASSGEHGRIDPEGATFVPVGSDKTFNIYSEPGYTLDKLIVDGKEKDIAMKYVFEDVQHDSTIKVTFKEIDD